MTEYVLILWLVGARMAGLTSATFSNEAACQNALSIATQSSPGFTISIRGICVPKAIRRRALEE